MGSSAGYGCSFRAHSSSTARHGQSSDWKTAHPRMQNRGGEIGTPMERNRISTARGRGNQPRATPASGSSASAASLPPVGPGARARAQAASALPFALLCARCAVSGQLLQWKGVVGVIRTRLV